MHYDYIIVGSGAGGGTIANVLAKAGKQVLIIERGDFVPREKENWYTKSVFVEGRYISHEQWTINGKRVQPQVHYNVGGATKFYGAALFRLRPLDFETGMFSSGLSPAWPISYMDFEPWYTAAEHMYHVHGQHGEDPTEGYASKPYPHASVPHEPRLQAISDAMTKAGYRPFHAPVAVLENCRLCNTCDGFPCKIRAKADAEVIGYRPIRALPNVTLKTNTVVTRVFGGKEPGNLIRGVLGWDEYAGEMVTYTGDTVIISAGAVNTAALLLKSGYGNDHTGRHYMCHNSQAVMAITPEANPTTFQKTLALNDFYPLGNIQMLGKSSGEAMRGESHLASLVPGKTLDWIASHAVDFWLTSEDMPLWRNRVSLNNSNGIELEYQRTNLWEKQDLRYKLDALLREIGMKSVNAHQDIPLTAVAHQAGTCRFGNDPDNSVLDTNCRVWGTDNLYVVDASFMPSVGAVNPALTVIANALRVGDHLLKGR